MPLGPVDLLAHHSNCYPAAKSIQAGYKKYTTPHSKTPSTRILSFPYCLCEDAHQTEKPQRQETNHSSIAYRSMSSVEAAAAPNGSPGPSEDMAGRPSSTGSDGPASPKQQQQQQSDGATAEHTVSFHTADGKPVEVTIVPRPRGKNSKRSWVWQVMYEFVPTVDGNNVFCATCRHLLKWKSEHGTRGLGQHYRLKHPELYDKVMGEQQQQQGEGELYYNLFCYSLAVPMVCGMFCFAYYF